MNEEFRPATRAFQKIRERFGQRLQFGTYLLLQGCRFEDFLLLDILNLAHIQLGGGFRHVLIHFRWNHHGNIQLLPLFQVQIILSNPISDVVTGKIFASSPALQSDTLPSEPINRRHKYRRPLSSKNNTTGEG